MVLRGAAPRAVALGVALAGSTPSLGAQTEYRDAEAATPVRVEDAVPTERSALDVWLASLRFERLTGGARRAQLEPRLAFGVAPRAELSVRAPFAYVSDGPAPRARSAGAGVGGMYGHGWGGQAERCSSRFHWVVSARRRPTFARPPALRGRPDGQGASYPAPCGASRRGPVIERASGRSCARSSSRPPSSPA
jgi:hypothetical protein